MHPKRLIPCLLLAAASQVFAGADTALEAYRMQGSGPFNAEAGRQLWISKNTPQQEASARSCVDCHGTNLNLPGKHLRTGKLIEAMNPAITAERLTDHQKIEKWFKRNCKWTFGRECTPQEKGDLILFMQQNG